MKNIARNYGMPIAQVLIATIIAGTGLYLYWINEPAPSVSYERRVLTPIVEPGGSLVIKNRVHRTKSCYTKVHRDVVDVTGRVASFERDWALRPVGWDSIDYEVKIPDDMTPGAAKLKVTVFWYCNPLQRWWPSSEDQEVVDFDIVPKGSRK